MIVSTPQDLVKMIVNKAVNMAKMMNVPVLGLVENMSYFVCPDCGKKHAVFGESQIDETAKELGLPVLAKLPIDPKINRLVDEGKIEEVCTDALSDFVEALLQNKRTGGTYGKKRRLYFLGRIFYGRCIAFGDAQQGSEHTSRRLHSK